MHIMCCCEIILYKSICIVYNMASWQSFSELEKISLRKTLPTSRLTLFLFILGIRYFNNQKILIKKKEKRIEMIPCKYRNKCRDKCGQMRGPSPPA